MTFPADPEKIRTPKAMARREFLLGAAAVSGLASKYLRALPNSSAISPPVRPAVDTAGSSEILPSLVTPNTDFFIRNHFTAPVISEENWNLEISGAVTTPLKLSYSDLLLGSSIRRPLTLECAGNPAGGRGVSTGVWSGVPLTELLKQAGLQPGATTVIFYGADSGVAEGLPPGTHYVRAIPIEKATDPTTLLAYEMNGVPLPPEHGFPLRALVAGWYGMDSVKWLTRVEVSQAPFQGYLQEQSYVATTTKGDRRPITGMRVNFRFIRPWKMRGFVASPTVSRASPGQETARSLRLNCASPAMERGSRRSCPHPRLPWFGHPGPTNGKCRALVNIPLRFVLPTTRATHNPWCAIRIDWTSTS